MTRLSIIFDQSLSVSRTCMDMLIRFHEHEKLFHTSLVEGVMEATGKA